MARTRLLRAFARSQAGSSAAEFVLMLPIMVGLILLAINAGLLMYTGAALNFAVADAARCGAVRATCSTGAQIENYARRQYGGFSRTSAFVAAPTATCGSQVSATGTYRVFLGFASFDVPMEATACYPHQPTA